MNISLGSTSQEKKNILIECLNEMGIKDFSITECNVNSKIDSQPLDELTVLKGANNRATNALKLGNTKTLGIGLEGGLTTISNDEDYYLVCAAVIKDSFGNTFTGISSKLILPKKISNLVREGKEFGAIIREEAAKVNDKYGYYEELISRKTSFKQAIANAFLDYFSKS